MVTAGRVLGGPRRVAADVACQLVRARLRTRVCPDDQGVTGSWTWEQTMRAIISHPLYSALPTLAERKEVFTQYQEERLKQEKVRPARPRPAAARGCRPRTLPDRSTHRRSALTRGAVQTAASAP